MTDDEMSRVEVLADAATPGPWHVVFLDDDHAMNLVAVSTSPDDGRHARWPDFDPNALVAATLVQRPGYVDQADGKWDENAAFIAAARSAVPALLTEVRRLRAGIAGALEDYDCRDELSCIDALRALLGDQ